VIRFLRIGLDLLKKSLDNHFMKDFDLFDLMSEEELESVQATLKSFIQDGLQAKLEPKKILVVGDVGLDRYVYGAVERISPEAPVPVALVTGREEKLGLSANVAQNLSSFLSPCDLVSMLGDDRHADSFYSLTSKCGGLETFFLKSTERPTTVKTRIISGQHHLLRLDDEDNKSLSDREWQEVKSILNDLDWPSYSSIILQDYGKGFLTESLCQLVIENAKKHSVPTLIDPSLTAPIKKYKGADYFKPNQKEVLAYRESPDQSYRELLQNIKFNGQFRAVINTLGAQGMSLYSDDLEMRVPTFAKKVFDVTGAGDTVIAALAFVLSHGLDLKKAAVFSNLCAGHVVSKIGAVTVGFEDLQSILDKRI
jgi:rfaE bifunctional protein kinase chain/domain